MWIAFFSDRTVIVRPPEDSTVIKGTTATLRCDAAHDPRISIRLVSSAAVRVVCLCLIPLTIPSGIRGALSRAQVWCLDPPRHSWGCRLYRKSYVSLVPPHLVQLQSYILFTMSYGSTSWLQYNFPWFTVKVNTISIKRACQKQLLDANETQRGFMGL